MQRSRVYLCAALFFTVLSCESEPPPLLPNPSSKLPPIAKAGDDMTVTFSDGFRFQVNGNQSYNSAWPHNPSSGLTMNWKQLGGPELVEFTDHGVYAEFIPSNYGAYSFELTVKNQNGVNKDSITMTVAPGSCNPDLEYVKAEFKEESVYTKTVPNDAGACVASGRLLLSGGDGSNPFNELHIYDIAAKSWKTAALPFIRGEISIGANKDYAFITAGTFPTDAVDIYEFSTGRISTIKLSKPRAGVSVTAIGNKVVFAGGSDSNGKSDIMDIYDMDNRTWRVEKFAGGRIGMVASVVGNKIYFSGGYIGDGLPSDLVDVYDVSSGQWTELRLNRGRAGHSAAVMGQNKIVFTGGYEWGGDYFEAGMEWLDLSTFTIKQECLFADYVARPQTSYAFGLAAVFVGQNLYSCYNQFLSRFDVGANKWKISKGMKDHDLAGFFSDGNRLLAIATKKSGIENRDNISIYEVKF